MEGRFIDQLRTQLNDRHLLCIHGAVIHAPGVDPTRHHKRIHGKIEECSQHFPGRFRIPIFIFVYSPERIPAALHHSKRKGSLTFIIRRFLSHIIDQEIPVKVHKTDIYTRHAGTGHHMIQTFLFHHGA